MDWTDFSLCGKNDLEVTGALSTVWFVTFFKISYFVLKKTEIHTDLEQLEGE